jgi:hypothetical protein
MNVLERAECLLDCGSSGNMNFTVIADVRGHLEIRVLEAALMALQRRHTLLRSSLSWQENSCHFRPISQPVPLTVLPMPNDHRRAWKPAAMAALRQRFDNGDQPLWRVSWLRADERGYLLITFHHAIADGLSAMALVQELLQHLGNGLKATAPPEGGEATDERVPDLDHTFATDRHGAWAVQRMPERQDVGLTTGYVLEELSAEASQALLGWSRERGLRLNATLHAAFLQAFVQNGLFSASTTASTVVNLRGLASPALGWDLMRLLRVCVDTEVDVDPSAPLVDLASQLHGVLQHQLRNGAPIIALNTIAAAVADAPSPRELWQRSWREGGLITNLGRVPVQAHHGAVELVSLFFVANIEPIALPHTPLAVLGALSFREQLRLTCFHIEQQISESQAISAMAEMKDRLLAVTGR